MCLKHGIFYSETIKPILEEDCVECIKEQRDRFSKLLGEVQVKAGEAGMERDRLIKELDKHDRCLPLLEESKKALEKAVDSAIAAEKQLQEYNEWIASEQDIEGGYLREKSRAEAFEKALSEWVEGIDSVDSIRAALIAKRDEALRGADMETSLLLSHTIAHLSRLIRAESVRKGV